MKRSAATIAPLRRLARFEVIFLHISSDTLGIFSPRDRKRLSAVSGRAFFFCGNRRTVIIFLFSS